MHHPGMQSEMGKLADSLESLLAKWDQTTDTWRDENARSIEEEHIEPIADAIRAAMPAIGHMSDVAQASFRAVGDPEKDR